MMSNYNDNKEYGFTDVSYSYKNSTQHGKKSPIEYDKKEIVGTRPAKYSKFLTVVRHT